MKFLNGGSLPSDVRCSKLLYLIFNCYKLIRKGFIIVTIFLVFAIVPDAESQRSPFDLRKPKPKENVLVGPFSGASVIGKSEDPFGLANAPKLEVSIKKFLIDEAEVSNKDYRRFVKYVRDSIVRTKLARLAEDLGLNAEDEGVGRYAFKPIDTASVSEKYYYENYSLFSENLYEGRLLNWDVDLIWEPEEYPDNYYAEIMDSIFLEGWETHHSKRMLDVKQLVYKYNWFDVQSAAQNPNLNPREFIVEERVRVYPDTLVWMKDFEYSINEQMFFEYFWHEQYDEYPVVGVNWEQAKAYCHFKTYSISENFEKLGKPVVPAFRLPTEAEWEFAAKNGNDDYLYPWKGDDLIDDFNGVRANFKPPGGYAFDGEVYVSKVRDKKRFHRSESGLFHMSGNVSEWTESTYNEDGYEFVSPLNPNYRNDQNPNRTIRGASWKDISYFLRVSTRDYEHKDSARSYIGFRTVRDFVPKKLDNN